MTSFDKRCVRYESIHDVHDEHWEWFLDACSLEDGDIILDCGCGYGASSKKILESRPECAFFIDLLDESGFQLRRARDELHSHLGGASRLNFIQSSLEDWAPSRKYDKILLKMVLHEVNQSEQQTFLNYMFEMLKPGGLVVIWDLALATTVAEFFRRAIRKKDELLEFESMVQRRSFLTAEEFSKCASESHFGKAETVRRFKCNFYTDRRIKDEFQDNHRLYANWIDEIDLLSKQLDDVNKELLGLEKYPDDSTLYGERGLSHRMFVIDRAIWRLRRPDALSLISRTTPSHFVEPHLAPSMHRRDLPEKLRKVIQEGICALGECGLFSEHRGLVRVSTYEIKDRGTRELAKDGLDFLYDFRKQPQRDDAFENEVTKSYVRHMFRIYHAKNCTDSKHPAWRNLTDYLNQLGAKEGSCSWLRIVDGTHEHPPTIYVAICVGDMLIKTGAIEITNLEDLSRKINGNLNCKVTEHYSPELVISSPVKLIRYGHRQLSADAIADQLVKAGQVQIPNPNSFSENDAKWRHEPLPSAPLYAVLGLAIFMIDAKLKYGVYFLPPSPVTPEHTRSETGAVFFASEKALSALEENVLFAFTSNLWSDVRGIELMSSGFAFLNTAYRDEIGYNSDERKFFVGKIIFPLLFNNSDTKFNPTVLIKTPVEGGENATSEIFNEWANALNRSITTRDLPTLIEYLRVRKESITSSEKAALEGIRHTLENLLYNNLKGIELENKIVLALGTTPFAGPLCERIRNLLDSALNDVHMFEIDESAIQKCKIAKGLINEIELRSREIIKDRCIKIQKCNNALRSFSDCCYDVTLPSEENVPFPQFRFVLSEFLNTVEALRVNAEKIASTKYILLYRENESECIVTWLETGSITNWTFSVFKSKASYSLEEKGIHRGLPKIILFGLENGAKQIDVYFEHKWESIWLRPDYANTDLNIAETPNEVTYGIRFVF